MKTTESLEKIIKNQLVKSITELGAAAKDLDWFAGNLHADRRELKKAA
ncbi:hypothetical protein MRB56_02555 [Halomonas cupida]